MGLFIISRGAVFRGVINNYFEEDSSCLMLGKVRPRGLKIVQELITKGRPTISLAMVAVKLDTGVESALLLSPQKVFMIVVPVEMEEIDDLVEVVMEKVTAKLIVEAQKVHILLVIPSQSRTSL